MVSISKEAHIFFRECTFIAPCAPLLLYSGKLNCGVGAPIPMALLAGARMLLNFPSITPRMSRRAFFYT
jgi:hypothetical protein